MVRYLKANEFADQPWLERRAEVRDLTGQLWSWKAPLGRDWQLWFMAVFAGIPVMLFCAVVAPGDTSRLGSAIGLGFCGLIGWVGLKAIDARIARRSGGRGNLMS